MGRWARTLVGQRARGIVGSRESYARTWADAEDWTLVVMEGFRSIVRAPCTRSTWALKLKLGWR